MLKILFVHHTMPDVASYSTILLENVIPILKEKTGVKVSWLIHRAKKLCLKEKQNSKYEILDIHDFDNAVDVVKKVKPDLIFLIPGVSAPDYAFFIAGQFCGTKIIGGQLATPFFSVLNMNAVLKIYFNQFFQRSSALDTNQDSKQFMKRGRFFLFKHWFLFKTMKNSQLKRSRILHEFFDLIRMYLRLMNSKAVNSKFKYDLIFADSEQHYKQLTNLGFNKNNLIITGNPTYDTIFNKIHDLNSSKKEEGMLNILFLTVNLAGQGGEWNKKKRDRMIKNFVREISKFKEYSVSIKIHPNNESLVEYQQAVNSVNPNIPVFQKGAVLDFLEKADLVITSSSSTAGMCSLLLKKPIIIWNYFNVQNDLFLERNLVVECKDISKINNIIQKITKENPISQEKIDGLISDITYRADGMSSLRITQAILKLLNIPENKSLNQFSRVKKDSLSDQ